MSPVLRRAFVWALGVAFGCGLAAPADARRLPHASPRTEPLTAPAADFDGDGRVDQARLDKASGTITLRLSATRTAVSLDGGRLGGAPLTGAAIHDVDVDGDPDLVALTTNGRLIVWSNGGGGRLQPRITGPPSIEGTPQDGHAIRRAHGDRTIAPASLAPAILFHNPVFAGHVRLARAPRQTDAVWRPAPRTATQQLPRPPPAGARL